MELTYQTGRLMVELPRRIADYRHQYPRQEEPQPAYLELAFESEPCPRLITSFNGEIGNAVPFDVYHGRKLRFSIPYGAALKDVRAAMRKVAPMCEELAQSYDTRWDGNNTVGVFDGALRDRIQDTLDNEFGVERY